MFVDRVIIYISSYMRRRLAQGNEWMKTVFGLMVVLYRKGYYSASPPAHGMPFSIVVLSGSLLMCAFAFDTIDGATLGQKLVALKSASSEHLHDLISKYPKNFAAALSAGDLLVCPPGYLMMTWAAADTHALRWNLWLDSGLHCENQGLVSRMVVAMLHSYPTLQKDATYEHLKNWMSST